MANVRLPFLFAEFIGCFFFNTVVSLAISTANPNIAPFAIGLVLSLAASVLGKSSGGHVNPQVSMSVCLADHKNFGWLNFLSYFVAQLGGHTCGALYGWAISGKQAEAFDLPTLWSLGYNSTQILFAEILGSFMLSFTVLCIAVGQANETGGLFVGVSVLVGAITMGPISGAGFNPGIAFGIIVVNGNWWSLPTYLFGPFVGSILAVISFRIAYAHIYRNDGMKDFLPPYVTKRDDEVLVRDKSYNEMTASHRSSIKGLQGVAIQSFQEPSVLKVASLQSSRSSAA